MAGSFSADISKFIQRTNGNIDKSVQYTVALTTLGLVMQTPVLTGRLRHNWQYGKAMPRGVLNGVDKDGLATQARIAAQSSGLKAGGVVWLVNNLPYAGRIEYGYSAKNPAGMVRITLAGLPAAIEQYVRGLQ